MDERLERLYRHVELVRGAGDPRSGKLCRVSFVAFLAGEGHSDRAVTASPLIRELAVRINDAMPQEMRQKLKPFVPRIFGTNDGRDVQRAAMLYVVAEQGFATTSSHRTAAGFGGEWTAPTSSASGSWHLQTA